MEPVCNDCLRNRFLLCGYKYKVWGGTTKTIVTKRDRTFFGGN